jgi:hypothetical protein
MHLDTTLLTLVDINITFDIDNPLTTTTTADKRLDPLDWIGLYSVSDAELSAGAVWCFMLDKWPLFEKGPGGVIKEANGGQCMTSEGCWGRPRRLSGIVCALEQTATRRKERDESMTRAGLNKQRFEPVADIDSIFSFSFSFLLYSSPLYPNITIPHHSTPTCSSQRHSLPTLIFTSTYLQPPTLTSGAMQINALLPLLALLAVPLTEAKSHRDVLGKRNDHHARAAAKVAHNIERREALAQTNPRALSDKPIRTVKKRGSQKCRPRGGQFSASAASAVSTASSVSSASASAVASSAAVVPSAAASPSPSPAPASSEAAAPSPAAPSVSQRSFELWEKIQLGEEEKSY